ncbi:MAG: hypothetical protein GY796_18255 [Chloroflexi bacterium]|nr:hypothetical protein [Chloroflexota bacterium]
MNDNTKNVTVYLVWGGRHGVVFCDYFVKILSEPDDNDPLSVFIVKFQSCRIQDLPEEYTKIDDIPDGVRNEVEKLIGTTVKLCASAIKHEIPSYIEPPIPI